MKSFTILLVEDNPDHAALIRRALLGGSPTSNVQIAQDGQAAIDYVFNDKEPEGSEIAPRPDLILLDIKLPKLDGFEVLQRIKRNKDLQSIPIVMLTTSTREEEIIRAYDLGANCYICKPVRFRDFMQAINGLQKYWLSHGNVSEL